MSVRILLAALLFLGISPQAAPPQAVPRVPVHVESLEYPPLARQARITGDVVAVAEVNTEGEVVGLPDAPTGHPIFRSVVEENVKRWRFQKGPTSNVKVTYHFMFDEQAKPTDYPSSRCVFDLPDSVTVTVPVPPVHIDYSQTKKKKP